MTVTFSPEIQPSFDLRWDEIITKPGIYEWDHLGSVARVVVVKSTSDRNDAYLVYRGAMTGMKTPDWELESQYRFRRVGGSIILEDRI